VTEAFKVTLDTELIVRRGVAEVQASGNGQIRLEDQGQLRDDTLTARASVAHEEARLGLIEDALCRVDELTDLQGSCPHCALAACDGRVAIPVVKELMGHVCTAQAEETQLDTPDIKASGGRFIQDVEILDRISAGAEFFDDQDVLARAPHGVDGDLEFDLARKKERKLGQEFNVHGLANGGWGVVIAEEMGTLDGGNQGRVHCEVPEGAVTDLLETGGL